METIKIEDENGKVYEFEKPDFECELLKVKDGFIFGISGLTSVKWILSTGTTIFAGFLDGEHYVHKYNLTPIKPKWYEDDNNFPALIYTKDFGYIFTTKYNSKSKEFLFQGSYLNSCEYDFRLATKEEVLSLYYYGK